MSKLIGAASIILNDEQKILLVRHSYGRLNWDLPGGKAEDMESAEETAKREVNEEIGLNVSIDRLTGVYYDPQYDMHHFVFSAKNENADQEPKPSSPEILECGYFSINELPKPMKDFTYNRIIDALHNSEAVFKVMEPIQWIE